MLSRDEELQRVQRRTEHVDEQEVIEADESSGRQSGSDPSPPLFSSPMDRYSPPPRSTPGSGSSSRGLLVPLAPLPTSNVKVQVSPRFHAEPKKAGGLPGSSSDSQSPGSVSSSPSRSRSKLGPTSSRATSSKQASSRDCTSSPTKQNAWRKPLPGTGPSASPTGPSSLVTPSTAGTNWEAEAERIGRVEDLELRFALGLSLAEAQSREGAMK